MEPLQERAEPMPAAMLFKAGRPEAPESANIIRMPPPNTQLCRAARSAAPGVTPGSPMTKWVLLARLMALRDSSASTVWPAAMAAALTVDISPLFQERELPEKFPTTLMAWSWLAQSKIASKATGRKRDIVFVIVLRFAVQLRLGKIFGLVDDARSDPTTDASEAPIPKALESYKLVMVQG